MIPVYCVAGLGPAELVAQPSAVSKASAKQEPEGHGVGLLQGKCSMWALLMT